MWEMLNYFHIRGIRKVFCNAELPGSFVLAILKYNEIIDSSNKDIEWVASSYIEGSLEDALGVQKTFRNHWIMESNTEHPERNGDVTKPENINYITESVLRKIGKVDAYTGDIGIEKKKREKFEEADHIPLHIGQRFFVG